MIGIKVYLQFIIQPLMIDNEKIQQSILQKYKVLKKLGSGAYGHVWKVQCQQTGEILALKKIFDSFQHSTDAQRTYRQISILKKIHNPNVINLHEVIQSKSGKDIYLIFDYIPTDLYKTIYEHHLEQVQVKYIIYQLLLGLHYLHSAGVIHRDLKPSNLLLTPQCQVKICDFGLARIINYTQIQENVMTEGVATRWYRAPQILLGSKFYDQKADLWSVGCILAEIILKNPLFNTNSTLAQFEKILQLLGRPTPEQIKDLGSEVAESLVKQCGNSKQKPHREIFGNIDQNCLDLIYKLLKISPKRRISALSALKHPYFKQFHKDSNIIQSQLTITLETDDNVKLSTEQYKQLISRYFVQKKTKTHQPQRFSDLKRQRSFGKAINTPSRKSSQQGKFFDKVSQQKPQKKHTQLFGQILKERELSVKGSRSKANSQQKQTNKQNMNMNQNPIDKFMHPSKATKPTGTFAALRKVTTTKFK